MQIENGTPWESTDNSDYRRTGTAALVDRPIQLGTEVSDYMGTVLGKTDDATRYTTAWGQIRDKLHKQFLNTSTMLRSMGSSIQQMYQTQYVNTQNKASAVELEARNAAKMGHEIAKKANLDGRYVIKDSNGNPIKNFKRRHLAMIRAFVKQAHLDELIPILDAGGNVEDAIQVIARRMSSDPEQQGRIATYIRQAAVKHMGVRGKQFTDSTGEVTYSPKKENGRFVFDADKGRRFVYNQIPGNITQWAKGKVAKDVVLSARDMVKLANEADQSIIDYTDKVFRPIMDDILYPALKDEFELSNPGETFAEAIPDYVSFMNVGSPTSHAQRKTRQQDNMSRNASETDKALSMQPNHTLREMLLDNMRQTKERSVSVDNLVLYGLDEFLTKHMKDVVRYQRNTFVTNWKAALADNAEEIRKQYGEDTLEQLQRQFANMEGTVDDSIGPLSRIANSALSRHSKVILQSPWVWAYQPLSLTSFIDVIQGEHLKAGIRRKIGGGSKSDIDAILKYSPYLKYRRSVGRVEAHYNDDSPLAAQAGDMHGFRGKGPAGAFGRASKFLSGMMTRADTMAIDVGILASLEQIKAENPNLSKEEQYRLAANLATVATNETQVSSEAGYMSNIRQSRNFFERTVSYMSGATSAGYNVIVRNINDWTKAKGAGKIDEQRAALRKLAAVGRAMALQATMVGAVKFLRSAANDPSDDDKKRASNVGKLALFTAESALGYIPGANLVAPIVLGAAAKRMGDKDAAAKYGFRVGRNPYGGLVTPVMSLGRGLAKLRSATEDGMTEKQREQKIDSAKNDIFRGVSRIADVWALGVNTTTLAETVAKPLRKWTPVRIPPLEPYTPQFNKKDKK
jgi:hypothetical protein